MATPDLSGYVTVAQRLAAAFAAHPELRIVETPARIVELGDRIFVVGSVTVYRTPDDPLPTVGESWEPFPGRTPYTRDSEQANAQTSALGRALGYMGFGSSESIATADDVARARSRNETPPEPEPARKAIGSKAAPKPATVEPITDAERVTPGMLRVIEAKAKRFDVEIPLIRTKAEAEVWLSRHAGFEGAEP